MKLSIDEIASLLLEQHAGLRVRAARCAALSARLVAGEPVETELAAELAILRHIFAEHNDAEQRLLAPYLALDDAWGPLRIDRMEEEHAAEHDAFLAALFGTTAEVAARFADFAEDIEAHMAAEERTFLSGRVIRSAAAASAR